MIEIIEPGLFTTVQDLGRPGYYHLGIPEGGALDREAAVIANALVGNEPGAAVLECTYSGPRLRALAPTILAIAGADAGASIDGIEVPGWTALELGEGQELSFSHVRAGARIYLAFAGGIEVPMDLGSRSTYAIGSLGGFEHRALHAGDQVPLGPVSGKPRLGVEVPLGMRPAYRSELVVRIMLGLYDHRMSEAGKHALIGTEWTMTPVADRMGMRYSGAGIEWRHRAQPFGAGSDLSNIVDAGYPVGSIQVPGGTQPIILHRDAVSGGGYAMVGTVISADMDKVAQSMPGTRTWFEPVTMDAALAARAERRHHIQTILATLEESR